MSIFKLKPIGAILGFAILKTTSKFLPKAFGGRYFGPRENVTVQSVATGAGSMSIIFEGAIPAMYRLKLLSEHPKEDFWRLITFTAVCAFYGCFFGIALRKFYIIRLKGIFPTPTATAITIRNLHGATGGGKDGIKKAVVLLSAFGIACVFKVASTYAPGIMWDWNIFWWIYHTTNWKSAIAASNWGWYIEFTPAFFGVGMLTGMNVGLSYLGGSVVAWGIIGPATLHTGLTFGVQNKDDAHIINYKGMELVDPVNRPSARYFLLWPGLLILIAATFTEVALNGPVMWKGLKLATASAFTKIPRHEKLKRGHEKAEDYLSREDNEDDDPCPPSERVPAWMWLSGTALTMLFTIIVLAKQYHIVSFP